MGSAAAIGAALLLRAFLGGLSPLDLVALGVAVGALTLVVFLASMLPARRAARMDPTEALRCE